MARAKLTSGVVIAAAADLADRSGYDTVTVSALAGHLGVQPASLYSHVRDRSAILDGVQELALSELADRIGDAIAGRSGREALFGLADAHRAYASAAPGRWTALQRPASPSTVGADAAARVVTLIWAVLRGYPVPEGELVHATRLLGATINGFINLEQATSFDHRGPDSELSWQRALSALDTVLRTWTTSPPEWATS